MRTRTSSQFGDDLLTANDTRPLSVTKCELLRNRGVSIDHRLDRLWAVDEFFLWKLVKEHLAVGTRPRGHPGNHVVPVLCVKGVITGI